MKKILLATIMSSSLFSMNANAGSCGSCIAATIKAKVETIAQITASKVAILADIAATRAALLNAELMSSSQSHADMERQNAVNRSIAEAAQDHDKQYRLQENAAEIKKQTQVPYDACRTLSIGNALNTAAEGERESVNSIMDESAKRNLYTSNQPAAVNQMMTVHKENFCSDADAAKGRCSAAAPELQNADLSAANLFEPNENKAYTEQQALAAKTYIQNLVNPFPTQSIPAVLENTPQGKAFLAAQMDEQRKLSVAEYSLAKIFAANQNDPTLAAKAMMPNPQNGASVNGVIEFYASKFLDPNKQLEIAQTNSSEMLLKELVNNMAFRSWLDYKTYEQMNRVEVLLASSLAIQAKESSGKILDAQRRTLKAPRN